MTTRHILLTVAIAVATMSGVLALAPARAVSAQAALPYLAYGVGLRAGQEVDARVDRHVVAQAVADRAGRWKLQIEPGPHVADGDVVAFFVDGAATGVTVVFRSGRFPAPPGIALAPPDPASQQPPATPAPRATPRLPVPAARPTATPRPRAACTRDGRPAPCQAFTVAPLR